MFKRMERIARSLANPLFLFLLAVNCLMTSGAFNSSGEKEIESKQVIAATKVRE